MLDFSTKHDDPEQRLGWVERIGYGVGGGASQMMFIIIGSYLSIYMTNVAYVDVAVFSAIIAVSRVLDGISDFIVGNIIDHTNTKFGKARVWLMRMCLPFALSTILLFRVPAGWPDMARYVYIFIVYNLTVTFCFTFLQIAHFSLVPLMTSNSQEQGLLGVIRSLSVSLGLLAGSSLFVRLLIRFSGDPTNQNTQQGYNWTLGIFMSIVILSVFVTVLTTKERVKTNLSTGDADGNGKTGTAEAVKAILCDKYWIVLILAETIQFIGVQIMQTSGTYYALYRLNDMGHFSWMTATILMPSFVIQLIIPYVMSKIGKKWTMAAGLTLSAIGSIGFGFAAPVIPAMIAFNIVKGIGFGATTGVVLGLVADMVTYTSLKRGIFAAGLGNAGMSAADKIGQGAANVIFGFTLASAGFNAQAARQPAAVISMVSWGYAWLPAICFAVSVIMLTFFFHAEKELKELKCRIEPSDQI